MEAGAMSTVQAYHVHAEVMTVVACENCRQKLRIPQSRAWIRVTCPTCRYEFNYRFGDREPPVTRASSHDSVSSAILGVLGLVLLIGGVVLFIGNLSGILPTFPYAGFITSSIGLAMMGAEMRA
jgi:hypothetical protein